MRSRGGYVNTLQVTDRIPFFFFFSEVGPLLVVVVVLAMNQNRLNGTFIIIIFIFTYRTACSSNSALRGSLLQGPVFRSYEKYMNLFLCSSSAPFTNEWTRLPDDCPLIVGAAMESESLEVQFPKRYRTMSPRCQCWAPPPPQCR